MTTTKPTVEEMNRAIHEFIGGEWAVVRFTEGGNWEILHWEGATSYYDLYRLCHTESQIRKKQYQVAPNLRDYEYHYPKNWDALMPVWFKCQHIGADMGSVFSKFHLAFHAGIDQQSIEKCHAAVYEFIVWYNQNKHL